MTDEIIKELVKPIHNKFSKRIAMKEELFSELLESVYEGGSILRGEKSPSRNLAVEKPDVQQIPATYRLSQKEFASMPGNSIEKSRKNDG